MNGEMSTGRSAFALALWRLIARSEIEGVSRAQIRSVIKHVHELPADSFDRAVQANALPRDVDG
jgi:hypothetical protein